MDVHRRNMEARNARNQGNPVDGRNARLAVPNEDRIVENAARPPRSFSQNESPIQREQARRYVDRR